MPVVGENGLFFQEVVNLHGTVSGGIVRLCGIAKVIPTGCSGDLFRVVAAVIGLPEFDISFFKGSGFDTGNIGGDFQIVDIVLNDAACAVGPPDFDKVLSERIHFRIHPCFFSLFVGEFQQITEPFQRSGKSFAVVHFILFVAGLYGTELIDQFIPFGFGDQFLQFGNVRRKRQCRESQCRECKT